MGSSPGWGCLFLACSRVLVFRCPQVVADDEQQPILLVVDGEYARNKDALASYLC